MSKNSIDFNVEVYNAGGFTELVGKKITLDSSGCLFQYKKPRSSKQLRRFVNHSDLVALYKNRRGDDVLLCTIAAVHPVLSLKGMAEPNSDGSITVHDESGKAILFRNPAAHISVVADAGTGSTDSRPTEKKKKKKKKG